MEKNLQKIKVYYPRLWSKELHETKKRWIIAVCHRRSGKTTASLNHLQRDASKIDNSRFAYVAPTYKQAKNIAWDMIKLYSRNIPNIQYNEAELTVKYPNGSKLTLYGADNPDSLRGIGLWGVVFDEYSQQPSNIFTEIIRPALADHKGYGIWIGTPKGKNDFYKLYELARKEENWLDIMLKASESGILDKAELEDARKTMTEEEYQQEFECSFDSAIKGAYYVKELALARKEGRIISFPHEKTIKVHTWWDLGVGDSTAILFFQQVNKEWRLFDCYEASGEGLSHYAEVLQNKGYVYGNHYAPHDIAVRELGTGKSRMEVAKDLGIDFNVAPNLPIDDGINITRMRFNTLWIDEDKCSNFINALSLYRKEYNDKMGEFKDKPLHDWTSHFADALRYWGVTAVDSKFAEEQNQRFEINQWKQTEDSNK